MAVIRRPYDLSVLHSKRFSAKKKLIEYLCRLIDKSRKIVEKLIASIYRTENRDGKLWDETLVVEISVDTDA